MNSRKKRRAEQKLRGAFLLPGTAARASEVARVSVYPRYKINRLLVVAN